MSQYYTTFTSGSPFVSHPGMSYNVYLLQAPISVLGKETPSSLSGHVFNLQLYHTGLGFQSTDLSRQFEFTFDYELVTGFTLNALLPEIVNGELVWHNQTEVLLGNRIDRNYWINSDYICTITDQQLQQYQSWIIRDWIPNNPIYSLFSASIPSDDNPNIPTREGLFNPFMRASTCDTFAYSSFQQFINLSVCIDYVTAPFVNVQVFVVERDNAAIVDYEANKQQLIIYYTALEDTLNTTVTDFANIASLIEQIKNAPLSDIPALLEQLGIVLVETLEQLLALYLEFEFAYYYGYNNNSLTASVVYWKFDFARPFVDYVQSNLSRSVDARDLNGNVVNDGYTSANQFCICNCNTVNTNPVTNFHGIEILVFILILFVVFILLYAYSRRNREED